MVRRGICCVLLLGLALCALAAAARAANSATARRSTSASQQFVVLCDDAPLRQRLVSALDDIRSVVLSELGVSLGGQTPVMVNIVPQPTNQPSAPGKHLRWIDTPDGSRVQIDIFLTPDLFDVRLPEQAIEGVLLTLKYRDHPPADGQAFATAPDWMIEALAEKLRVRNQMLDAGLYRRLLKVGKIPLLQDFLAQNPARMDAAALGIYRAYACSLLALLQDQPGGKAKLLAYLQKVPANRDIALQLLQHDFPDLNQTPASLLKWWSLSLARISASDRYISLTVPETERELTKCLAVKVAGQEDPPVTLEELTAARKTPQTQAAGRQILEELIRLNLRANALYRPVLAAYQDVATQVERGKVKKTVLQDLATLAAQRERIQQQISAVSDYLNWFQATQMPSKTGEFDSYLKLANSYDQPRPPSKEPIGKYLDALESELK